MSVFRLEELGGNTLARAEKLLAGIPKGAQKAVQAAMQRAVSTLRTKSTKVVQERYDIARAGVRAGENITVTYTMGESLTALVTFRGAKIPLYRFGGAAPKGPTKDTSRKVRAMIQGSWKQVHPSVAARGHQLKSTAPATFEGAFVAQMKSGHIGIFARGKGGSSIKEVMGSSMPQMLGNEEVAKKLAKEAGKTFEKRLEHEITRLLNGW